uniref:NADH dehydrogenase subunit 4L n=1 Tax=Jenufa perforata TaxID=993091 RepID=A0A6G7ITP3_9CHLO|nr:NADH dehydrogenase subunit 4L [Jenufa perforata]QII41623.1 NADH dehydrogenase subunit 4L [Jenufa perforata]
MHQLLFFWSLVLFIIGAMGTFLNRRHFFIILLCIELMLLAVNIQFFTASALLDDINGQFFALWVLTAAAAETSIGLALCVIYTRLRSTLDVEFINLLKG